MEKEYILSFSSFYKAAYAKDVLEENGLNSTLRRLPPQVAHSCSTGLYLRLDSVERARQILEERQITNRGIYRIDRQGGESRYTKI